MELVGGLPGQPVKLAPRVAWLLRKVAEAQRRVEGYEGEMEGLKKVLKEEY